MLDQMEEIASDEVLQQAYRWLCARRADYAPDADVWRLRWRWAEVKPQIQAPLRAGACLHAASRPGPVTVSTV
ncbi:MAG: hypothetical protein ACE10K_04915 [Rhodothermales bacterium]